MQQVSTEYAESMKSALRERGYMIVTFGLVNQDAQKNSTIDVSSLSFQADIRIVFTNTEDYRYYPTLEENYTKVDGSMILYPSYATQTWYTQSGIISGKLVSEENYTIRITPHTKQSFKGMTIDFGDNYPVNFDITSYTDGVGTTLEIRDNTESLWHTENTFTDVTSVVLTIYKMKNTDSRARIYSILYGYAITFNNSSILDSSLETYVSPIAEDLPQIDFSVTIENLDQKFNLDNPDSIINFIQTGQEMDITYGYMLPESQKIEWIQGQRLYCSDWDADETTATIRAVDIFRNLDGEYYKGKAGLTVLEDLAKDVIKEAGLDDTQLVNFNRESDAVFTYNPIPRVSYKEALQLIANAFYCSLLQDRTGVIRIKGNYKTSILGVFGLKEDTYSNVDNIINSSIKYEYGTLAQDYTRVDGSMYFLPKDTEPTLNTGYVSSVISGSDGTFETDPFVNISFKNVRTYYSITLTFGSTLPDEITIRMINRETSEGKELSLTGDEISTITTIKNDLIEFDDLRITFKKTEVPYNRIILNTVSVDTTTGFSIDKSDMLSYPTTMKEELVKNIVVPWYSYVEGTEKETITSNSITVLGEQTVTFTWNDAAHGYEVLLNGETADATIVDSGCYFADVKFPTGGTYNVSITGYKYQIYKHSITKSLNDTGKTITWDNPLMSKEKDAQFMADWLADYYSEKSEYEYDTRGNPELDAGDVIYQYNEFVNNMKVRIIRSTLNFNQTFSGKLTTRRLEE